MYSFNNTKAAIFPMKLCFLMTFLSLRFIVMKQTWLLVERVFIATLREKKTVSMSVSWITEN